MGLSTYPAFVLTKKITTPITSRTTKIRPSIYADFAGMVEELNLVRSSYPIVKVTRN